MRAHSSSDFQRILGSLLVGASLCAQAYPVWAQQKAVSPAAPVAAPTTPKTSSPPPGAKAGTPATDTPSASVPPNTAAEPRPAEEEAPAAAEAPSEEDKLVAKEALARGLTAYQAGNYDAAAAAFLESERRAPSADAQFWYAMALDLQGKTEEALAAFETFFANPVHSALGADRIEPARQRFEVLKKIPATVTLQVTPAEAQLTVNGEPQPGAGTFTLSLTPGKHVLQLSAPGFETVDTELDVKPAQKLEQSFQLTPLPAAEPEPAAVAPPPAPAPAEPRSKVPAYVTLGVAGAGAIVGGIFGLQALSAKSDFDKGPTTALADDVERNALIADMAFGLAITLGITGVVLLTSDEPAETATQTSPQQSKLQVAPFVSPTGGGAAARATF